ncbi:MAG TPA: hypothetical protein PLZ45_10930 [Ferruginibacter sp.]|nr:hypothetical protein [Chitinophagaceae bacterium]HRI25182.1 hypothetical protein [Ferruginibacter sp.]
MKKAVFTIQVFSLLIMLPAYIILELDYRTVEPGAHKTNSVNRENSDHSGSRVFESQDAENTKGLFDFKSKASI